MGKPTVKQRFEKMVEQVTRAAIGSYANEQAVELLLREHKRTLRKIQQVPHYCCNFRGEMVHDQEDGFYINLDDLLTALKGQP